MFYNYLKENMYLKEGCISEMREVKDEEK